MIPPFCPRSAPPGERAVFQALASSDSSTDWIVLHSLGLANHVRQVEGEADFVAIVPGHGVAVIEVKSHQSVSVDEDGTWHLGNQRPTTRSPFRQADEAKHSIINFLRQRSVGTSHAPFIHLVWFTSIRARTMLPSSAEWLPWQVLDRDDLNRDAVSALLRTIEHGITHLASKSQAFRLSAPGPSLSEAELIAHTLRPRFDMATVHADQRHERQDQLSEFLEEQFGALDAMEGNRAVLFTGPAGSGKTFIAMEAAKRMAEEGLTGRLLCFNRLLGNSLHHDMGETAGLEVGTLHKCMSRSTGLRPPPNPGPEFWSRVLPEDMLRWLLEESPPLYDFLVIDEVQDIAKEQYLDVLDLMVKDGLSGGRILCFGDFERQAIFGSSDGRELLKMMVPSLITYKLTTNCRNLPRIGEAVNFFAKLNPGYSRFRRADDGIDPEFLSYQRGEDQSGLLANAVRTLQGEGYKLDEIIVLSPLNSNSTAHITRDLWLRQILVPVTGAPRRGKLRFSTVQSFKGLEALAVVLTDLDQEVVADFESILYVGATRATDRLIGVIEKDTLRSLLGGSS